MQLERLKRWQWCVIGLIVGPLLAWAWLSLPDSQLARNIGAADFEHALAQPAKHGNEFLRNVIVRPRVGDTQVLTGLIADRSNSGDGNYVDFSLVVQLPYTGPDVGRAYLTLQARLADAAVHNRAVHYHYAWWSTPAGALVIWTEASVLLIGGLWPTVLDRLIGAGFGRKHENPVYDLDRFASGDANRPMAKPVVIDENNPWLTASAPTAGAGTPPPQDATPAAPVPVLSNAPIEPATVAAEQPDKQYAGMFYPTIVHRTANDTLDGSS